jgi:hypothetical protein
MKAFEVATIEGFEATIFAASVDEAANLFCTHHERYMGRMPPKFIVEAMRRPRAGMKRRHLAEAIERGLPGVGYYLAGRGWSVISADLPVTLIPQWPD